MGMETSADDAMLILNGWRADRVHLKALFFSPDLRCCATVHGFLHASVDDNLFIHPSESVSASTEVSALVFRLDAVQRYDFAAADVVESATGLTPGQLAKPHGETMLTINFKDGSNIHLSNLPGNES